MVTPKEISGSISRIKRAIVHANFWINVALGDEKAARSWLGNHVARRL